MFRCGWRWGFGMREGVRRDEVGDVRDTIYIEIVDMWKGKTY